MIISKTYKTNIDCFDEVFNTFNNTHPEYTYRRMDMLVPNDNGIMTVLVLYDVNDAIASKLNKLEVKYIRDFLRNRIRSLYTLNKAAKKDLDRAFTIPELEPYFQVSKKNTTYYLANK